MKNIFLKNQTIFLAILFASVFLIFGEVKISEAATIYVDGSLTNDCLSGNYSIANRDCTGTDGTSFTTIQAAVGAMTAGDTTYVRAGTYSATADNAFVTMAADGSAGDEYTIQGYGTEIPVIEGTGYTEDVAPVHVSQDLFYVSGDYWIVKNFEFTLAGRHGLSIEASNCTVENIHSHANWMAGISSGRWGEANNNTFRYIEAHNNRHYAGILVSNQDTVYTGGDNITVEYALLYNNGYTEDGTPVGVVAGDPRGGGNSDGFVTFKNCVHEGLMYCENNLLQHVIVWGNSDDGIDISWNNSIIKNNIAYNNGPEASNGFKMFSIVHNMTFIGNVAYDNVEKGFEMRLDSDETGEGLWFYNNLSMNHFLQAFFYGTAPGTEYKWIKNNLNTGNSADGNLDNSCTNCADNYLNSQATPNLANTSFIPNTAIPPGTIAQRWQYIWDQFEVALTPSVTETNLIDQGTWVSGVHCANAGDIGDCRTWYGAAPDIGAFEYSIDATAPSSPTNLLVL